MENHQIIAIDSDNKINSNETHSNFTYNIKIKGTVNRVCLRFASIPKTFYLVNTGSNTLTLTENGTPRTITIVPGNYNFKTFATSFSALLNAGGLYTYTITSNTSTGKYTITASSSNAISITFPSTSTLYKLLGFNIASTNVFAATILTSANVCQFSPYPAVIVRSSIVHANDTGYQDLGTIPIVNTPDMSYITYSIDHVESVARRTNISGSSIYSFRIYDLDENIIELNNGGRVNFELVFWRQSSLSDMMKIYFTDELLLKHKDLQPNNIVNDSIQ